VGHVARNGDQLATSDRQRDVLGRADHRTLRHGRSGRDRGERCERAGGAQHGFHNAALHCLAPHLECGRRGGLNLAHGVYLSVLSAAGATRPTVVVPGAWRSRIAPAPRPTDSTDVSLPRVTRTTGPVGTDTVLPSAVTAAVVGRGSALRWKR